MLVLATASNIKYANEIAGYLKLFNAVIASSPVINMEGQNKRRELDRAFASTGYAYIGNSRQDLPVWEGASSRLIANASKSLVEHLGRMGAVEHVFANRRSPLDLLRAIRIHQWVKNILVFVPVISAHKVTQLDSLWRSAAAFVIFSLVASSVYLLNDLADLNHDRRHPRKRNRPLAAGIVGIPTGAFLIVTFLALSMLLSVALPPAFQGTLLFYFVMTFLYSFWLKQIAAMDVIVLTGLYTVRFVAGGAASSIPLSVWLLTFSGFLFLSLALIKRYTELREAEESDRGNPSGRGYHLVDTPQIATLGIASGTVSVLVVALYVSSPQVQVLYRSPALLLLLCPVLFYWLMRVWLLAGRKLIHDDPIVFTVKDRVSYYLGILVIGIVISSTFLRFNLSVI